MALPCTLSGLVLKAALHRSWASVLTIAAFK
jgi:hypothetical protein